MSFDYYEGIVQKGIDDATALVNQSTAESGQKKLETLILATKKIEESSRHFSELQNVIILLPTNERATAQRKVQLFDTRIKEIEGRIEANKQRAKLLSNASLEAKNKVTDEESLEQAQNAMGSAYEIGTGILSQLKQQHNTLSNAKSNTDKLSSSVSDTAKHVSNMERIAKQNKLIIYAIIGLLIAGILLLLYLKF